MISEPNIHGVYSPAVSHVKQEIHDHEISPSYKHVMGPFESTFKTFAANNGYPSLGTYDTGRQIIDLNFCRFVLFSVTQIIDLNLIWFVLFILFASEDPGGGHISIERCFL